MLTLDQVLAAQKASLQSFKDLTSKSVERLVELNAVTSKTVLAETEEHVKALLKAKDVQEIVALQSNLVQPLAEKTASYNRHLYDITAAANAELSASVEELTVEAQKKFKELLDNALKTAPTGSESAVAFVNSAVSSANSALESVQKAVKQATALAEANLNAVAAGTATTAKAAKKAAN